MARKILVECPYCGSEEYDCFDDDGGGGYTFIEKYICFECDNVFRVEYEPVKIVK